MKRVRKLKKAGYNVTIRRIIFCEKYLSNIIHLSSVENSKIPMIEENWNEIKELRDVILQLQKDIQELKNN